MLAIITLLLIITMSIIVTRIATIALVHTGMSKESARFQSRSAFTGSGFTTTEAENVVNHPVRRRIIMLLMLVGNAGLVTAISTLILSFINTDSTVSALPKVVILVAGVTFLWILSYNKYIDRKLSFLIERFLKRFTSLDVHDYVSLMHLAGEYRLAEVMVGKEHWIANRTLADTRLSKEGLLVLGVKRFDGTYLGAPRGSTLILPDDVIIVYGRTTEIESIDQRRKTKRGDYEHIEAMKEQEQVLDEEEAIDPATDIQHLD
jgi:hypothetical protein